MNDRTQIAAMAMQGLLSGRAVYGDIVTDAVAYADALLAELSKVTPPRQQIEPKEGPPSGSTAGEAGDTKEGLRPRDLGGADGPTQRVVCGSAATESAPPPVPVFECEASWPTDLSCAGEIYFDPVTKGRFCSLHIAVDEGARREMHRLHGDRNRPAAKARRIAEALP